MKLRLIMVGKNTGQWVESYITDYRQRIRVFTDLEVIYVKESKNTENPLLQLKAEAASVLKEIRKDDFVVLLDERGKMLTSPGFAGLLQNWQDAGKKNSVFIVGGAHGFSEIIKARADLLLSLSLMTFTHQMIRVFFMEQLYRAYTIMHKLPYHHE